MPGSYKLNVRHAIVLSVAVAAIAAASTAGARPIVDPPASVKRIQPLKTTRFDAGYPRCAGVHVRGAAAAKAE
jgi:hypothetical protein